MHFGEDRGVLSSPRGLPVTCSLTSIVLELGEDGSNRYRFHNSIPARSPRRSKQACQVFSLYLQR